MNREHCNKICDKFAKWAKFENKDEQTGVPMSQETYEALSNGLTAKQLVEFANIIISNDYSSEQIKDIYKFEKTEKIY